MKLLYLVLLSLGLIGCNRRTDEEKVTALTNAIYYIKDHKSDVCFAAVYANKIKHPAAFTMATVPCEKVEHLLINK